MLPMRWRAVTWVVPGSGAKSCAMELHTGDLVREDSDGRLYLEGRRSHLINVDGQKVHPVEIEEVLLELAWVSEAAAVGELDESGIERVVAHVALVSGVAALGSRFPKH